MINLYDRLLDAGVQTLSLNSNLCRVISNIYSDHRSFNDNNNPLKGRITQDEARSFVHKADIIRPLLPYKDSEFFIENYMEYCFRNNLCKDHVGENWESFYKSCKQRFDTLINDSKNQSDSYYARWNRVSGLDAACIYAAVLDESQYNWERIFNSRILTRTKVEAYSSLDKLILSTNLHRFEKNVVTFVEDTDFNKRRGSTARKEIYFSLILSGKLTKKIARRIRSDGSEDASLESIKFLLSNSKLYPNFSELASQITDSNFHSVATYLAHNLPINTLAFLAGTKFDDVRATVVNRMTSHQDGNKNA